MNPAIMVLPTVLSAARHHNYNNTGEQVLTNRDIIGLIICIIIMIIVITIFTISIWKEEHPKK